ncbi:putative bifunctional diguanylate cyclase/phosphodiesterase [Micromonosporaceae bacterium Da 78-11]
MGFVTWDYAALQRERVAFSAREREGVAYLQPVVALLTETARARSRAVVGAAPDDAVLGRAIGAVDAVDRLYGAELSVSSSWGATRTAVVTVARADHAAGSSGYVGATEQLLKLIVGVSDRSNLTLDPELDSYYAMDALVFKIPVLIDRVASLSYEMAQQGRAGAAASDDAGLLLAQASVVLRTAQNGLDDTMATAFSTTHGPVSSELTQAVQTAKAAVADAIRQADGVVAGGRRPDSSDAGGRALSALARMAGQLVPHLRRLLTTRIDRLWTSAYTINAAAAGALVLLLYLLAGIYRSAVERRRVYTVTALIRRAASIANSADTVDVAAERVVRDVCTTFGWRAGHAWTDTPRSRCWFVTDHEHQHAGVCGLQEMAAAAFAPEPQHLPLDLQTRIVAGPDDLGPMQATARECGIGPAIAVPILAGGESTGMLAFYLPAGVAVPHGDLVAGLEQIGLALGRVVERQRTTTTLEYRASHDPVTTLPNRWLLQQELEVTRQQRRHGAGDAPISAVLLINLDRFRVINDAVGHAAGDDLLREAAQRIVAALSPADMVARLAADEFAVLAHRSTPERTGEQFAFLAKSIQMRLEEPVVVAGHRVTVHASIGICLITDEYAADTHNAATVLRDADAALQDAKRRGTNQIRTFDIALRRSADTRLAEETALSEAISAGQLVVHYQPIVGLDNGRAVGAEALVRWQRPGHGMVAPDRFIALAEETGLIVDLGRWVLRQACRDAAGWPATIPALADATISVNVSTRQLTHPRFLDDLDGALHDAGLPAHRLIVEITESALINDTNTADETLHAIRARGVQLAIDDFGTGYSSMSYVQKLPATILKIDKSFVDPVTGPGEGTTLCEVVLKLAEATGMRTVAEGIENSLQAEALRRLGCHRGQGYYWSRPVSHDALHGVINALEDSHHQALEEVGLHP